MRPTKKDAQWVRSGKYVLEQAILVNVSSGKQYFHYRSTTLQERQKSLGMVCDLHLTVTTNA